MARWRTWGMIQDGDHVFRYKDSHNTNMVVMEISMLVTDDLYIERDCKMHICTNSMLNK